MKQGLNLFSDVASVSKEAFDVFTLKHCWESWILVMTNLALPSTATIKYNHTVRKSNIKNQDSDSEGLEQFS